MTQIPLPLPGTSPSQVGGYPQGPAWGRSLQALLRQAHLPGVVLQSLLQVLALAPIRAAIGHQYQPLLYLTPKGRKQPHLHRLYYLNFKESHQLFKFPPDPLAQRFNLFCSGTGQVCRTTVRIFCLIPQPIFRRLSQCRWVDCMMALFCWIRIGEFGILTPMLAIFFSVTGLGDRPVNSRAYPSGISSGISVPPCGPNFLWGVSSCPNGTASAPNRKNTIWRRITVVFKRVFIPTPMASDSI